MHNAHGTDDAINKKLILSPTLPLKNASCHGCHGGQERRDISV
jgi:hypothetical protein